MRKFPTVISFYTKDTLYEKEVQLLIASCKKFNLEFQIDAIDSLGSWEKNCCFKPKYILEKLNFLKKPLLWVDADALFVQEPKDFALDCDFSTCINKNCPDDDPSKVISNTVYVNYTQAAIDLLKSWEEKCLDQIETWDQICLRDALRHHKATVQPMPLEYCRIVDDQNTENLPSLKEMVILHFQASRILKKIVNQELAFMPFLEQISSLELKLLRCSEDTQNELAFMKDLVSFFHA